MNIFILLLFTLIAILLTKNSEDYLSVKSTSGLKGLLALGIVFHHVSQWITTGDEFFNFNYMGTYIVSIFFFLSGYGLYIQNEKKENYLDNFLKKRLSRILVPFVGISLVYLVYRIVVKNDVIDVKYFVGLFTHGSTIIYNGWFVDVILMLYVFFFLSFRFIKDKRLAIISNFILCILYIYVAIKLDYGFWWYNSTMPFVLGLVWARNKDKIDKIITNNYAIVLALFTVFIFVSHKYSIVLQKIGLVDNYSYALAANVDNLIFTIYFILLVKNINFDNKYLKKIGGVSFELYMIHDLVLSFFGRYFVSSNLNDVVFTGAVLCVSLILAKILNFFSSKVIKYIKI